MNILFTRFPLESAHGGAENQTMWLAAGLKDRGHTVKFLGSCPVLLTTFAAAGFDATKLQIGPPPVTTWGAASFLWRRKEMLKKLVDATHAIKTDAAFMLSLSEKILLTDHLHAKGVNVFWIEHDRVGRWLGGNPWLGALKNAAKHATIICVSELSRKKYVDLGFDPSRIIVIPNGIPLSDSHRSSPAGTSELHLGTVARLSPEKGLDTLLQAISALPEFSLTIVGKGPQEGYIRSLIAGDTERLGIGVPRIKLIASVAELGDFYANLDAFVLPSSDHDPFGLVAAEAMSYGVPTVVTDACGIAGSLKSGEEILVAEAGSSESLERALRELLDAKRRESLGVAGKRAVISRLGTAQMVDAYDKVLRE